MKVIQNNSIMLGILLTALSILTGTCVGITYGQTMQDNIIQETEEKYDISDIQFFTPTEKQHTSEIQIEELPQTAKTIEEEIVSEEPKEGEFAIPEGYGDLYTVTCYGEKGWFIVDGDAGHWVSVGAGSGQKAVHDAWVGAGCEYEDGFAVLDGRYLIATTVLFGKPGDMVDFYLEDGTVLNCTIADTKCEEVTDWDNNPANMWGHLDGRCVVEFEVHPQFYFQFGNPGTDEWHPELQQSVRSSTSIGSIFDQRRLNFENAFVGNENH